MSVLTEDQQREIIESAMEGIKQSVIDSATSQAAYSASNAIQSSVKKIVDDFVREEIAPDIEAALIGSKDTIVKAAVSSAENMAVELANALTSSMAENLGSSYSRKKIISALFD